MSIRLKGSDRLSKLAQNANELSRRTSAPISEIFNHSFMVENTQHDNLTDFVRAGGFVLNSAEDFKAIPDEALNEYIVSNTKFDSWSDMQLNAARIWAKNQLLK